MIIDVGTAVRPVIIKAEKKTKSNFGRRLVVLAIDLILNNLVVFLLVGILNRIFGRIVTIFLAYPASKEYADAYTFGWHRKHMAWNPHPVGLFRQNGGFGIMFVIPNTEKEFEVASNLDNLCLLAERFNRIRKILGAAQMTFSGALPGILFRRKIIIDSPEARVTVAALLKAEKELRRDALVSNDSPMVLLGGGGFIGAPFVEKLVASGREVYSVEGKTEWPHHLKGREMIVVNLTRDGVLPLYIDEFWPGMVLLNETYPEPRQADIDHMKSVGVVPYHIVGLRAKSWPRFPRAYAGGIPCCAGYLDKNMEVIIKKL